MMLYTNLRTAKTEARLHSLQDPGIVWYVVSYASEDTTRLQYEVTDVEGLYVEARYLDGKLQTPKQ